VLGCVGKVKGPAHGKEWDREETSIYVLCFRRRCFFVDLIDEGVLVSEKMGIDEGELHAERPKVERVVWMGLAWET